MDLNLIPGSSPRLGVMLDPAPADRLLARLDWAEEMGFTAVELPAHGGIDGFHAPDLGNEYRAELAAHLSRFSSFGIAAPHQETFDVSLVSPSAAIRRASLSEVWSVCRLASTLARPSGPRPIVLLRTGLPPMDHAGTEADSHLQECLAALGHTAGQHRVTLAVLSRDRFRRASDLADLAASRFPQVGIALDLRYLHEMGETPLSLVHMVEVCGLRLVYAILPAVPDLALHLAPALIENGVETLVLSAAPGEDLRPARDSWLSALGVKSRE